VGRGKKKWGVKDKEYMADDYLEVLELEAEEAEEDEIDAEEDESVRFSLLLPPLCFPSVHVNLCNKNRYSVK